MDFKTFEDQFVPFCTTPGVKSQKPSSYYRAIQSLADYLGLSEINEDSAKKLLDKENEIKDKSSSFYKALLKDLEQNGRKSYLENGFLSAAFPFFRRFIEKGKPKDVDVSERIMNMTVFQKIFFGAPGTGKSYKVNSILAGQRKYLFTSSDVAKSNHYAETLSNESDIGCNVWITDCIGVLEKKLAIFESDDKRDNPLHSALRAYIEWFKKYKEEQREIRTTFHPDYDYAQFVGAYKPKKVGDSITYTFVPQVFAKAYAAAWRLYLNHKPPLKGVVCTEPRRLYYYRAPKRRLLSLRSSLVD